ncbi:MAG: ABC transporter permease subunit [Bacilli bacterium]
MDKSAKKVLKKTIYVSLGILILLVIWEISSLILNNYNVYPDIIRTFTKLFYILSLKETYSAIFTSLGVCLLCLLVSTICGIIFGVIAGLFEPFKDIFSPFIAIMKVIPTAVIVILLLVFVKSFYSTIIVVFIVVFPIIYESVINGIQNIDVAIKDELSLDGTRNSESIFKIIIPEMAPYLYVGLVSSFGFAIKVEIMSEILIGSNSIHGLGRLIFVSYAVNFDYVELFSLSFLTLICFAVVDTILYFIKNKIKKL